VIVRFVDIGGIDDHDCLNFSFHNERKNNGNIILLVLNIGLHFFWKYNLNNESHQSANINKTNNDLTSPVKV